MANEAPPKFAVLGLGRFGLHLARTLTQSGAQVIGIDRDRDIIDATRDQVTLAIRLDTTDEAALRVHGIDEVQAAIVGIGTDFESAILTVATLRKIGVAHIICRAESDRQAHILSQVGADVIVKPEAEAAQRWAYRLTLPILDDVVELGEGHSLVQLTAPPLFHNQTPAALQLRQKYNVNLVAIKRVVALQEPHQRKEVQHFTITIPQPDTQILPSDTVILVGSNESLGRLTHDAVEQ